MRSACTLACASIALSNPSFTRSACQPQLQLPRQLGADRHEIPIYLRQRRLPVQGARVARGLQAAQRRCVLPPAWCTRLAATISQWPPPPPVIGPMREAH